MGRLSDLVVHDILDSRFGAAVVAVPATYYVGLSSTTPTSTGGNVTEPATGGYERLALPNNVTVWPPASARLKSNGVAVTFATPTADWGLLTHFVLYDALVAGNFQGYGELGTGVTIGIGSVASFAPGQLVINAPGT